MTSLIKRISGRFSGSQKKDPELGKLKEISKNDYKGQAIWFLNAFWHDENGPQFKEHPELAETVWKYFEACVELDPNGREGYELDEVLAHRLFERMEMVMTVVEMRAAMRKVDVDFNKYISLLEFLIYKFGVDWRQLANAEEVQGGEQMQQVLQETQALFDAAQAALEDCKAKALEAEAREKDATEKEALAVEAELIATQAEERQVEAEKKVAEVVAELKAEEAAHAEAINVLEKQSARMSIGIVKRGKAKNELAQLKATETTGLQAAKLSQEAALRRQQKMTKQAAMARSEAQRARVAFEEEKKLAIEAKKAADEALSASVEAFREAEESLEAIKAKYEHAGRGAFWWMDRELEEAKKYMSKKQLKALEAAQ